jgi:hypothetical protein
MREIRVRIWSFTFVVFRSSQPLRAKEKKHT